MLLFTLLLAVTGSAAWVAERSAPGGSVLVPKFWVIFGFLAGLTMIAYVLSRIGIRKGPEFSVYAVMGGIVLKLIFSMVFVLVYVINNKVDNIKFAVNFFSLYFLFTGFEIYALLTNLRTQNKK
jgi:hypothetical protein